MDFVSYLGSYVHVVLSDGFFFIGKIVNADSDGIVLIDKLGKRVSISNKAIMSCREAKF